MIRIYSELIKPLYDLFSTPFYKIKFLINISTFTMFKKFIKYDKALNDKIDFSICLHSECSNLIQFNGKCKFTNSDSKYGRCCYPCYYSSIDFKKLYSTLDDNKLYDIYNEIKGKFEYECKPFWNGTYNNRARGSRLSGRGYYENNCYRFFSVVYSIIMEPILQEEKRKKAEQALELKKQQELLEEQKRKDALTKVKINKVYKITNYSIKIEFEIEETNEKFEDVIKNLSIPIEEYKYHRFLYATKTTEFGDVFNKDFLEFQSKVENQSIYVDIKREDNKITSDTSLGYIYNQYKN